MTSSSSNLSSDNRVWDVLAVPRHIRAHSQKGVLGKLLKVLSSVSHYLTREGTEVVHLSHAESPSDITWVIQSHCEEWEKAGS